MVDSESLWLKEPFQQSLNIDDPYKTTLWWKIQILKLSWEKKNVVEGYMSNLILGL